jgi:hypothetical protein
VFIKITLKGIFSPIFKKKLLIIFRMEDANQGEALFCDRTITVPRSMYHEGILLEAGESTLDLLPGVDGEAISTRMRMDNYILGSPEVTHPDAHYQKRIGVMFRMIKMIREAWRSDLIHFQRPTDSDHTIILYQGGLGGWELLVDMIEPNNVLAFRADYDFSLQEDIHEVVKRHKAGEDIFGEKGLEFLIQSYKGWKIPIIGVTKMYGFDYRTKYIFTRGKTEVEETHIDGVFVGDSTYIFGFDEHGRVVDHSLSKS